MMGPIGCPETSVINQPTLSNNPEEGRLKFKALLIQYFTFVHECFKSAATETILLLKPTDASNLYRIQGATQDNINDGLG
jgi:hypothetical protein